MIITSIVAVLLSGLAVNTTPPPPTTVRGLLPDRRRCLRARRGRGPGTSRHHRRLRLRQPDQPGGHRLADRARRRAVTGQIDAQSWALLDIPLTWGTDTNANGAIEPNEVTLVCDGIVELPAAPVDRTDGRRPPCRWRRRSVRSAWSREMPRPPGTTPPTTPSPSTALWARTTTRPTPRLSGTMLVCILGSTGIPQYVIAQLSSTRALDGMQTATWERHARRHRQRHVDIPPRQRHERGRLHRLIRTTAHGRLVRIPHRHLSTRLTGAWPSVSTPVRRPLHVRWTSFWRFSRLRVTRTSGMPVDRWGSRSARPEAGSLGRRPSS